MSRASRVTPSTPSKSQSRVAVASPKPQTRLRTTKSIPKISAKQVEEPQELLSVPLLNIKEAIALKRAEAKKALSKGLGCSGDAAPLEEDARRSQRKLNSEQEDLVELGRVSIHETVERARSTGNLNISARSLACIPNYLFECHLGVTPAPLKLVPVSVTTAYPELPRGKERPQVSWFESQDLITIKARTNEIVEIQPEISLFGSLKTIDLHSNHLESIPASFANLSSLSLLDLSSNRLTHLPPCIFSLPSLTILNLSHNHLRSLPFSEFGSPVDVPDSLISGGFFAPNPWRADVALPRLHTLDLGHNKLTAASIDVSDLPAKISTLILSHNPLGPSAPLLEAVSRLEKLKELRMDEADIADDSFLPGISPRFPQLQLLELGETQVTEQALCTFFKGSPREVNVSFDVTTSEPAAGELCVIIGKRVVKEAWEIEAEKRFHRRRGVMSPNITAAEISPPIEEPSRKKLPEPKHIEKEPREIEAELGLPTEGERRRARTAEAASGSIPPKIASPSRPKQPIKEAWELEAEQGLLTEGGRRRARAHAALASSSAQSAEPSITTSTQGLASATYYSSSTNALTLPPSVSPPRGHARSFSLLSSPQKVRRASEDVTVPTPVLPLCVIVKLEFAAALRVLVLNGRRGDSTFSLPPLWSPSSSPEGLLPNLEELDLESCMLGDTVPVSQASSSDEFATNMRREKTVDLLAELFPSLRILNLSYNSLTSDAFSSATLISLLLPSSQVDEAPSLAMKRKGLKVLRLRGNPLTSLDGFEGIAALFKGNRQVDGWQFEELDLRDNIIAKLPPLLGLLPVDVLLVDGNTFRIPQRKVWEREGTKGLLAWLRGRIE